MAIRFEQVPNVCRCGYEGWKRELLARIVDWILALIDASRMNSISSSAHGTAKVRLD